MKMRHEPETRMEKPFMTEVERLRETLKRIEREFDELKLKAQAQAQGRGRGITMALKESYERKIQELREAIRIAEQNQAEVEVEQ
ncbi:MAG: hypothetical protein ACE5JP_16420 [Candidatus Bipolaricaulia bacterium]